MTPAGQVAELVRRDLRLEGRSGDALRVTAPFGAAALLIIPLAVGTDVPLLRTVGPGLYWAVVLLFGVLVAVRPVGESAAQRAALQLAGVSATTRLLGRAAAAAILLLALELALAATVVVLYDPRPAGGLGLLALALVAPLVAAGLGLLGALAEALVTSSAVGTSLAPLLVVPLALPLLLAATQVVPASAYAGGPWLWLLLALTVDLTLLLVAVLAARPLEEVG